ncbi:hypothetical protein ABZ153_05985 [Streptomyces sp. NPDC006290]|uniref:hypothetical protein n=1 Tax=Streptomyces sp. NPDC006290 TaxID=3156745 RepID=UPI0033A73A54
MSLDQLRREVFFLGYHLHWPHGELMDMAAGDRREFVDLLVEQIQRENAQVEAARERT